MQADTIETNRLLLLAKRVGKQAGFTPRMLQLLEYYIAFTTAKDWEEGSRPIVFQSLARTAMDLEVGERQIQKLEKRLFDIGAITWNASGNHKRFGRRDPRSGRLVFAYGVDLTPLAYLQEELQAKLQEKQLYAEAWRATKREISEARRGIRERLVKLAEEGVDSTAVARLEARYREIAYELRCHIDLSRLRTLAKQHMTLYEELGAALRKESNAPEQQAISSPAAPAARKRSRSHAKKVVHQEQITPLDKKKGPLRETTRHLPQRGPVGAIGMMTPSEALRLGSEAFRAHLTPTIRPFAWSDIIEAAYRRRPELGISQRSWAEACGLTGRAGAALRLLLTDQATGRDVNPVTYPAAYFRRLTQIDNGSLVLSAGAVSGLALPRRR